MVTTIQVEEETLKMLSQLKKNMKVASYNEVINRLIKKPANNDYGHGLLGKKDLKWVMKDLRDKHDRF